MGNVIAYRVLLLIAVTCCAETISAQISAGYSCEFYNSAHGLPSSEIISLAKDSKGFLWIGTSAGISRYDGYEFHNYNRSKEGDILGYVNAIAADRDHVWIGTGAGLFCYYNNEIIRLSAPSGLPQGVNDIFTENDGTIWLATENGPAKISLNDTIFRQSKKIQLANYILPQWDFKNRPAGDRRLDHIKKAADGTVYMADLLRLFVVKENSIDLLYTITKDRDHILSLFPVSRSKIFFTTTETEIHKVENGVHTNIQHKVLFQPGVDDGLEGVWQMGTFGLYYFHPQTSVASRFINTMAHGVDWPGAMLKDDNFFWVASHTGLVKIKPYLFTTYDAHAIFPAHQDYYSFLQLKNGNLLLGSNRGTIILKEHTGFDILRKNIVPTAEVKCLYEDERGWVWTGSGYQGLALIKNNQVKRFTVEDGLHDNSFSQFLKTSNGKLWAIGDHGVSEIIVDVKGVVSFKKYYRASGISRHAKFYSGIETPDGNMIIGGEEGLFSLKNDDLHPVMIDKKTQPVKSIIKDNEKNIWIATDGEGILKCAFNKDNNLEIVKQFTKADGLNTLHYLSLLADNENNIWAGSSIGLTLIGQQGKYKDKILHFDQSDGFTKPGYNSITLYQASDSTIWAGTTFGFISFKPDMAFLSSASPFIYIAGIKQIKKNALIMDTSSYPRYSYNNNSFNFSFSALDYANPKGIQYFYKLEGLDTNWISAGNLRSVTYENLSPHNYSFRVKALNNKGKWSENEAVWSFSIKTPFWKQAWFILLCAGAIIALLLFFIRKREVKQMALQKQKAAGYRNQLEKEMEVLRLHKDFATSQLTALRMQMNPHFIFNALNSIQHYMLQGNVVEANKYLSKFSKLQRDILHCSSRQFISLEKELEILTAYLQLEQFRFGGNFTYKINMTDEIEPVEIMIPPMILQPFVENSIWHGLMPLQTERKLSIYFDLESEDILVACLRDNGIGRAASVKLKQTSGQMKTGHESKGMSMVQQRLQLLQQQYDKPFEAAISDITDIKGNVMGTEVKLKIFIGSKKV
jgi:ligand-binding sensor domain-containing protein